MKDMYLVIMTGINTHEINLVDKDVWDWIDPDVVASRHPCPDIIRKHMWNQLSEEHDDENEMIEFYRNEFPEARASYACDAVGQYFPTTSNMMKYVKSNNINIAGECNLPVY